MKLLEIVVAFITSGSGFVWVFIHLNIHDNHKQSFRDGQNYDKFYKICSLIKLLSETYTGTKVTHSFESQDVPVSTSTFLSNL
jgi:hypothetical protein